MKNPFNKKEAEKIFNFIFKNNENNSVENFLTKEDIICNDIWINEFQKCKNIILKIKSNKQKTKNQHYVPRFYLRKFENSYKKLITYDVNNKRFSNPSSVWNICSGIYYNFPQHNDIKEETELLSLFAEEILWEYETKFWKIYKLLVENILKYRKIPNEEIVHLCIFVSQMFLRGKNVLNDNIIGKTKDLLEEVLNDLNKTNKDILNNGDTLKYIKNQFKLIQFSIISSEKIFNYWNLFFNKKIIIYIAS